MHWELTPIVVSGLLVFGLYRAAKDVKTNIQNPPTEPDLIQDQVNSYAASAVLDGTTEAIVKTSPALKHLIEAILHNIHAG